MQPWSQSESEGMKWYGWGYTDCGFVVRNNEVYFSGDRYAIGGTTKYLPNFKTWAANKLNVDLANPTLPPRSEFPTVYPESIISAEFVDELQQLGIPYSVEGKDRLKRSHGQTLHEIFTVRTKGLPERIPDAIIWPGGHKDVCEIVRLATKYNTVVIPFGGGTSVSGAASCPSHESRPIVVVHTTRMNRQLKLNEENLTACFEVGVTGKQLEETLQAQGYTCGHEPDSLEFSSLGGWVATRASGMKKNVYGNIEDIMVGYRFVTPTGVLEKCYDQPRTSCGPDFAHIVLGSEGTLGMVTEVTLKIRPVPAVRKYNAFLFRDFESGVQCVREIARQRCQPASVRLLDNDQFQCGQALEGVKSVFGEMYSRFQKFYLSTIKNYDWYSLSVMTVLFEGNNSTEVNEHFRRISKICESFGGFNIGEAYGKLGYDLTFVVAYIRDLALTYRVVCESFETSVPWDKTLTLCNNVKRSVAKKCEDLRIEHLLITCRVTQTYDTGCCVYFYLGFNYEDQKDPVSVFDELETLAREEIMKAGGSLSHHHGIGKIRSRFYRSQVSDYGVTLYRVIKQAVDPNNIFGVGNILSHL